MHYAKGSSRMFVRLANQHTRNFRGDLPEDVTHLPWKEIDGLGLGVVKGELARLGRSGETTLQIVRRTRYSTLA